MIFSPTHRASWRKRLIAVLALGLGIGLVLHHVRAALLFKQPPVSPVDRVYPYIPSPNHNWRPIGTPIDCIVLHATAQGTLQNTVDWFLNPQSKVSAHFVVDKDGSVVQMVPVEARAWHAGVSVLDGVTNVNDYSIGIEIVNLDDGKDPYTEAQYQSVARIILLCRAMYDIPDSRIVTHASIALPPGRKDDPLGFDVEKLHSIIAADEAGASSSAASHTQ